LESTRGERVFVVAAGKLGAGTAALDVWVGHRGGLRRILRRSQFTAFRSLGVEAVE